MIKKITPCLVWAAPNPPKRKAQAPQLYVKLPETASLGKLVGDREEDAVAFGCAFVSETGLGQ